MRSPGWKLSSPASLALCAGGALLLALACSDGSDPAPVAPPAPPAPTTLQAHKFTYDSQTLEYTVEGVTVSQDDVDRDLVGSLCSKCHASAVDEVKASVHYRIAGRTDRVMFPGGGAHGMLDRACGLPATTGLTNYLSDVNMGECAKCHVGRYMPVMEGFFTNMFAQMGIFDAVGQAEQVVDAGLDCLICHSEEYKAVPADGQLAAIAGTSAPGGESPTAVGSARAARDNADFNRDGQPDLVIDVDGDGIMDAPLMFDSDGDGQPDTPWPTVAQDRSFEAIASIGPTNEHTCLRCHEHARTGYKRGTLFIEGHDVHAGAAAGPFQNADNQCTVCHLAHDHKFVRGHMVGGDLAAADYPAPPPGTPPDPTDPFDLTCSKCHDTTQPPLSQIHLPNHLDKIACETCHIPYGSGITYSLFGHGGQVSFARNAAGKDTKLVVADMYVAGDRADLDMDFEAYKTRPILTWFNGGTSFLAQSLAVKGSLNAKITPFKPMANGMVFDARYFNGVMMNNDAGTPYNAHSMYRFYEEGNNAEAFYALGMLDMAPDAVRNLTMGAFMSPDPDVQTMALMFIFPNLVYFDKAKFGYEHYLTPGGSPFDANGDGVIDAGQPFNFDMFAAANSGLQQFAAFNGPMGFPPTYEWYPSFQDTSDVISMKLPDGSLIKMFLQMQAAQLPPEQQQAYLDAVANYPSYSQITLGGHGVAPKGQTLGSTSCLDCHGTSGALAHEVPVGRKLPTMTPMGQVELPLYSWKYYNVRALVDLGLSTTCEDMVQSGVSVDIDGNTTYLRESRNDFVVNWFQPNTPGGYYKADDAQALAGTNLTPDDLTWKGGEWMPVLEPVVDLKPNWEVLGLPSYIVWQ